MPKLAKISLGMSLPFLNFNAEWEPNRAEQTAAWELLVELGSRTAVMGLADDEGALQAALASLYSLFGTTRDILRRHGPGVASSRRAGETSFAVLAQRVLEDVLRPFLSKWHPLLDGWLETRPPEQSVAGREAAWPQRAELRDELRELRKKLRNYVEVLGHACGAEEYASLVRDRSLGTAS